MTEEDAAACATSAYVAGMVSDAALSYTQSSAMRLREHAGLIEALRHLWLSVADPAWGVL